MKEEARGAGLAFVIIIIDGRNFSSISICKSKVVDVLYESSAQRSDGYGCIGIKHTPSQTQVLKSIQSSNESIARNMYRRISKKHEHHMRRYRNSTSRTGDCPLLCCFKNLGLRTGLQN